MTNGADPHPFYCEVEGCEAHGERVDGSPVYHYVCRPHAEQMGLHVVADHEPMPPPVRAIPLAIFDGFSEALGRPIRACSIEQVVIALEDALVADEPLEQVRELARGLRFAAVAEPEQIPSVIAPGF